MNVTYIQMANVPLYSMRMAIYWWFNNEGFTNQSKYLYLRDHLYV